MVSASYQDAADTVKAACQSAIGKTPGVLSDPAPAVYVTKYGESAIEYTIYCWTATADYLSAKFALAENLRPAFAAHGVTMTYNHLNVHIVPPQ